MMMITRKNDCKRYIIGGHKYWLKHTIFKCLWRTLNFGSSHNVSWIIKPIKIAAKFNVCYKYSNEVHFYHYLQCDLFQYFLEECQKLMDKNREIKSLYLACFYFENFSSLARKILRFVEFITELNLDHMMVNADDLCRVRFSC